MVCSYAKHHLPNYGVFDEFRYFKPGNELHVLRIRGVDVAIAICEDLWQDGGPVAATAEAGAGLLAVINASPYERDKDDVRGDLVRRRAQEAGCPLAYVNLVGGQDELVFDGDTMIAARTGTIIVRALQFVEDLVVADLDLAPGTAAAAERARRRDRSRRARPERHDHSPPPHLRGRRRTRRVDHAGCREATRGDGRGLSRPGHGPARLLPQERDRAGLSRTVGRHRLIAGCDLGM